jgi:hypothetical protein
LTYVNNNNSFNYAGIKARLKWLTYEDEKGDSFFAGVNFEVSNTPYPYEPSQHKGEVRFIVGKNIYDFDDFLAIRLLISLSIASSGSFQLAPA